MERDKYELWMLQFWGLSHCISRAYKQSGIVRTDFYTAHNSLLWGTCFWQPHSTQAVARCLSKEATASPCVEKMSLPLQCLMQLKNLASTWCMSSAKASQVTAKQLSERSPHRNASSKGEITGVARRPKNWTSHLQCNLHLMHITWDSALLFLPWMNGNKKQKVGSLMGLGMGKTTPGVLSESSSGKQNE